jgi:hypothetical protein
VLVVAAVNDEEMALGCFKTVFAQTGVNIPNINDTIIYDKMPSAVKHI